MKILYFKELKKYALDEYLQFENSEILDKLIESNIITMDNQSISFRFVGMIALTDCIIIVFPKYKTDPYEDYDEKEDEYKNYTKNIFEVFEKYRKSKSSLLEKDWFPSPGVNDCTYEINDLRNSVKLASFSNSLCSSFIQACTDARM